MPPNRPQLNSHCRRLFLEQAIKGFNKNGETSSFAKFLLLSNKYLRLGDTYALGLVFEETEQFGMLFCEKNVNLFYKLPKFKASFEEALLIVKLIQPKLVKIYISRINDEAKEALLEELMKNVVELFAEVKCRINMRLQNIVPQYAIVLNGLASKVCTLSSPPECLTHEGIDQLNLDVCKINHTNLCQLKSIIKRHKLKTLEFILVRPFNDNQQIDPQLNLSTLKHVKFVCYNMTDANIFAKFLERNGSQLNTMKLEYINYVDAINFDSLVRELKVEYDQVVEFKKLCQFCKQLNARVDLTKHSLAEKHFGDNWKQRLISTDLFQNGTIREENDWHYFNSYVSENAVNLEFLFKTVIQID